MIHTISIDDPRYPRWLREIADPPERLYAQGNLDLLLCPGIAMVGMRRCSKRGELLARDWARELSRQGLTVVSGLAFGIDAAAHRGALEGTGRTIAVVPACLPDVTPVSHRSLAKEIVQKGGLLLSEWDLPRPLNRNDYLVRNRLVSGLCRGVIVVEAALRSGALNTVKHALEQNRDVMAVPGRLADLESGGCLKLLQQGARLVTRPEEVLEHLGLKVQDPLQPELPLDLLELYETVRGSPKTAAEFSSNSMTKLTELELRGLVTRDALGRYKVV